MEGSRSAHRRTIGSCVAALCFGALFVLSTGTAAAAPADPLTPSVDCVVQHDDGSWTAVLGYGNAGRSAMDVPRGAKNHITPDRAGTVLPSRFQPGQHRGVASVTVERGAGVVWHLGDDQLKVRATSANACPPPTEMPAEGNGTGVVVALGLAGITGAVVVHKVRRRALVPAVQEVDRDA